MPYDIIIVSKERKKITIKALNEDFDITVTRDIRWNKDIVSKVAFKAIMKLEEIRKLYLALVRYKKGFFKIGKVKVCITSNSVHLADTKKLYQVFVPYTTMISALNGVIRRVQ